MIHAAVDSEHDLITHLFTEPARTDVYIINV